ncbi:unnamed protein product [Blepharisma stoltei]|uniref:Phosphoglycerate mutase n=1 Tax=Blepharisma stoltei TaxID=1481888 RepID=A0AAU9ITV5_9CILI|nr:unnamed protein product [Blepharisma stoltei]
MELLSQHLSQAFLKPGTRVIMLRHAESVCNLAGTLAGWTDSKLSDYGKRQANLLYQGLHPFYSQFKGIYSSDLKRCIDTTLFATLYSYPFRIDERLRECYFGDHEGEHFDTMPELQATVNSPTYQAPNGESWVMVKNRAVKFFKEKLAEDGVYLCVSHGGLICTLTIPLGHTDAVSNASIVGIELKNGVPEKVEFSWTCPEILTR